jgi:hypothetical protein
MKRFSLGWFGKEDPGGEYVKYEDAVATRRATELKDEIAHLNCAIILLTDPLFNAGGGTLNATLYGVLENPHFTIKMTPLEYAEIFKREKDKLTAELEAI